MATSNGRGDAFMGPCQNMLNAYFGGLDTAAQGLEPAVKSVARANLEVIGFWNRRAQAWLEIPGQLSRCRTPQDLFTAQTQFWQTAFSQYQDSTRKVMALYSQAVPGVLAGAAAARKPERDFITFPEPPAAEPHRSEAGRRAA